MDMTNIYGSLSADEIPYFDNWFKSVGGNEKYRNVNPSVKWQRDIILNDYRNRDRSSANSGKETTNLDTWGKFTEEYRNRIPGNY